MTLDGVQSAPAPVRIQSKRSYNSFDKTKNRQAGGENDGNAHS